MSFILWCHWAVNETMFHFITSWYLCCLLSKQHEAHTEKKQKSCCLSTTREINLPMLWLFHMWISISAPVIKPRKNMSKCVINVAINTADANDDNDTVHFMYGLSRLIAIIANCTF